MSEEVKTPKKTPKKKSTPKKDPIESRLEADLLLQIEAAIEDQLALITELSDRVSELEGHLDVYFVEQIEPNLVEIKERIAYIESKLPKRRKPAEPDSLGRQRLLKAYFDIRQGRQCIPLVREWVEQNLTDETLDWAIEFTDGERTRVRFMEIWDTDFIAFKLRWAS